MTTTQSYVTYTGNGVATDYTFSFPYLEREHIIVLLDEVATTDFSFVSDGTIRLDTAPAVDVGVIIRRQTPKSGALLQLQSKATLKSEELNAQILQTLYASQEAIDISELIRAGGLTIPSVESAKVAAQDAKDLAIIAKQLAEAAQAAAESASSTAVGARDVATAARDQAVAAEDAAADARDIATSARDTAVSAKDQVILSENAAKDARDIALAARDTATSARDQAAASEGVATTARDQALAAQTAAENAASPLVSAVAATNAATVAANQAATTAQALVDSLDQIDNTSDANKPVSNAVQAALNQKLSIVGADMAGNGIENLGSINGGPLGGFRNKIINGDFDFWQRGTSQTGNAYGSDDRWINDAVGTTHVHSQQSHTIGQSDVPTDAKYYSRTVVTSVAGASNYAIKYQRIEGVRTLAGKTVTVTFWAKADAAKNIATSHTHSFGTGGSPSAAVNSFLPQTHVLTTSWQKFSYAITVPSISGKTLGTDGNDYLQLIFWFDAGSTFASYSNSLGQQSGTFDIAHVSLVEGDATGEDDPFEARHIQQELALCQRYYEIVHSWSHFYSGAVTSGRNYFVGSSFKVNKRANPSMVGTNSGDLAFSSSVGSPNANTHGFYSSRAANATNNAGFYYTTWTADAELQGVIMNIISTHNTENGDTIRVVHADGEMFVPDNMSNRHRRMVAEWEAIGGNGRQPYVAPPAYPTKEAALQAVNEFAQSFTENITGPVPLDEKLSWDAKEAAAKAVIAGTATSEQQALLDDEAALTSETTTYLANIVVAKAAVYSQVVSRVAGLRRALTAQIEAEADPYSYEAILTAGKAQAQKLADGLGL